MYLHADVQRLLCTKERKIIHRHILLLDIRLWLKVASCFLFLKTIFLNVILIINSYHLCFGKWLLLKCDDWLIILGNTTGNLKRDITLIFTIYGQGDSFSQLTVRNSFQLISARCCSGAGSAGPSEGCLFF